MIGFPELFPAYWKRLYPIVVVLGVLSIVYMVFCPRHTDWADFFAGMFVTTAIVGWLFARKSS
ncbi:MAG: hypothetical protein KGN02_07365 [bacterium]|nr:hypothetical protein [bacterium]